MCGERTSRRELRHQKQNVAQVLTYFFYEVLVFLISLGQFSGQKRLWCLLLAVEHLQSTVCTECICQSAPLLLFLCTVCTEIPVRSSLINCEFSNSLWATWTKVVQQSTVLWARWNGMKLRFLLLPINLFISPIVYLLWEQLKMITSKVFTVTWILLRIHLKHRVLGDGFIVRSPCWR